VRRLTVAAVLLLAPALPARPSENAPPVFSEGSAATRRLEENSGPGLDIGSPLDAADADGHRLTWALEGEDADFFALDSRNGQLRTAAGVVYDYEARQSYRIVVRAEDGHGGSASINVAVEVTDVRPLSAPGTPTAVATRDTLRVRWSAPDPDWSGDRDYEGEFRAAGAAAYELAWNRGGDATEATIAGLDPDTLYEVRVRVRTIEGGSDWSGPGRARTLANAAPVFADGPATTREFRENTAGVENVGAPVSATDAEGDPLVYTLEGADAGAFGIDPDTGQITSRAGTTYDYETKPSWAVIVRATDDHGASSTSAVAVSLLDVEDAVIVANAGWDLTVAAGGTAWLDGTASRTDQGKLTYAWAFVSSPGESRPELAAADTHAPSFVAAVAGTYVVRLTVSRNAMSETDEVTIVARPASEATGLVRADLLADTNRDASVDSSDEVGEETWSEASGAVFSPNADDDDGDGLRDAWDNRVNGEADLLDMAPVVVKRIPGLHRKHRVTLEMKFSAGVTRPRMFMEWADGTIGSLIGLSSTRAELPREWLAARDLKLYVESRLGRDVDFDGHLALDLIVEDDGVEVSRDRVALRGSPILFSHHLQASERVFVVPVGGRQSTMPLVNALESHLPPSVVPERINASKYADDVWIQDSMQGGFAQRPGSGAPAAWAFQAQMHRGRDLRFFLRNDYLEGDHGYSISRGRRHTTYNYGGNVEVIPPHSHGGRDWPFGRIVIGESLVQYPDGMDRRQKAFLNAQEAQAPLLVVDTGWLAVGHVDEVFTSVPNREAAAGERPWVVVIGSTALAISLLEKAVEEGAGDAPIFAGRGWETTPKSLLADSSLMKLNDEAQAKIDTVRKRLMTEIGLEAAEFREVPALFRRYGHSVTAYMPNIQNLLVAGGRLFVPDPEGPVVNGADLWRQAALDALTGLGLTAHFVDIWVGYHLLLGGIHCGTNVDRAGTTTPAWWAPTSSGGEG
jgi:protein-arginine deiminase